MSVQQHCPGKATALTMSWLVALLLETPPPKMDSLHSFTWTWSDELPHTPNHSQTHEYNIITPLSSRLPIVFTVYRHASTSQSLRLCWNLPLRLAVCDVVGRWSWPLSSPAALLALPSPQAPYLPSLSIRADQASCSWVCTTPRLPLLPPAIQNPNMSISCICTIPACRIWAGRTHAKRGTRCVLFALDVDMHTFLRQARLSMFDHWSPDLDKLITRSLLVTWSPLKKTRAKFDFDEKCPPKECAEHQFSKNCRQQETLCDHYIRYVQVVFGLFVSLLISGTC